MDILELREIKAEKVKALDKFLDSFDDGKTFTKADDNKAKEKLKEIEEINIKIKELEKIEQVKKDRASEKSREPKSTVFADIARAMKNTNAPDIPDNIRAITSTSGSTAIQDPLVVDEIIYALQESNELEQAGVQFVNTENYRLAPKVTAYPTANWQSAESAQIPLDSALTIGSVKWELKDMAIRVRVTNQFLMDSSDRGRRLVQESMRKAVQAAIAGVIFAGSGASGQPTGIENFSGVQTVDANSANIVDWSFIIDAIKLLSSVNVPIPNISVFFSPTGFEQLADMADTTGQPLMKPALLEPVRFFAPTNFVPETYDTNTTTKMFLGDYSKIIVGISGAFEFILDQTRADYLETEFLIHMRMDVQATHEDNFCQIIGISLT